MKYWYDLYRQIWNGLYNLNPEMHESFKYQYFQREVIELKFLLDRDIKWEILIWETFENFEKLYELLLVSERECVGQNIIHTKSFIYIRTSEYKYWRKKMRMIYETLNLEYESWKKDERRSPELKLRREIRIVSRSSEL